MFRKLSVLAVALSAMTMPALATPTYTFSLDASQAVSVLPAGTVTLTQKGNDVQVTLSLNPGFGILNTGGSNGGSHTPFAFNVFSSLASTLSILSWTAPSNGSVTYGKFTLVGSSDNKPYGTFTNGIAYSTKNGTGNAYFGGLVFDISSTKGFLLTDDFINTNGYYFSADITYGGNTGAVAAGTRAPVPTPEPASLALLGASLIGLILAQRRKRPLHE